LSPAAAAAAATAVAAAAAGDANSGVRGAAARVAEALRRDGDAAPTDMAS
jgi:hypothetical protein